LPFLKDNGSGKISRARGINATPEFDMALLIPQGLIMKEATLKMAS
jgi:hypothetical protein